MMRCPLSVTEFDGIDQRKTTHSIWKNTEETKKLFSGHMFSGDYTMLCPPMDNRELENMTDTKIVERSIRFLDAHKQDDPPFFLFISINNPHASYYTTEYYDALYNPEKISLLKKQFKRSAILHAFA